MCDRDRPWVRIYGVYNEQNLRGEEQEAYLRKVDSSNPETQVNLFLFGRIAFYPDEKPTDLVNAQSTHRFQS